MPEALDRAVMFHIAEGAFRGLTPAQRCALMYVGNDDNHSRDTQPHATLLPTLNRRLAYPIRSYNPATGLSSNPGVTTQMIYRRQFYSLQFYRRGAYALAEAFDDFAQSPLGLMQEDTAFSDGRIRQIRVIDGGSGYSEAPTVVIEDTENGIGGGATAEASIVAGSVAGVRIINRGRDYVDAHIRLEGGGGTGAKATCIGYGFRVNFPIEIQQIDAIVEEDYEERAVIELGIDYASVRDYDTGRIDANVCEIVYAGETERGTLTLPTL